MGILMTLIWEVYLSTPASIIGVYWSEFREWFNALVISSGSDLLLPFPGVLEVPPASSQL
jgi:hypothetical protein